MQYATARDGVRIAFGTAGDGPTLLRVPSLPFSHSQREWERGSEFYEKLAEKWSVVQFDPRGTGLSERNVEDFSLETRLLDIEAVLDKLGAGPVALHGMGWSGPLVVTYAVRHPERVSHLILDDSHARTEDFMNLPQIRALDQLTGQWDTFLEYVAYMIYGYGREEAAPVVEHLRACVSPEGAQLIFNQARGDDVSDLLPLVTQPTLVVQHEEMNQQAEEAARELAALIPNARLVMIAGQAADDTGRIIHAIADLLASDGTALLTTPNILMSDGINPFHVHEYRANELGDVLQRRFGTVEVLGIGATEPVHAYFAARSARIRRIMRIDPLGFRNLLPRGLVEWLFARFAVLVRRQTQADEGTPQASWQDFPIGPADDRCLDLLAICKQPTDA